MNADKLAQMQKNVRMGGKGTPRRKTKRAAPGKREAAVDDRHVQSALKRLNVQSVANVEAVNMFRDDGKVLHFNAPKVQASVQSNTFAVYGKAEEKELTQMLPGVLGQLGNQSTNYLQKMIEQMGGLSALQGMAAGMSGGKATAGGAAGSSSGAAAEDDDDDIPELVENFDEVQD